METKVVLAVSLLLDTATCSTHMTIVYRFSAASESFYTISDLLRAPKQSLLALQDPVCPAVLQALRTHQQQQKQIAPTRAKRLVHACVSGPRIAPYAKWKLNTFLAKKCVKNEGKHSWIPRWLSSLELQKKKKKSTSQPSWILRVYSKPET